MYTEGLQIGENSYVLSDESGDITLLSAKGTPEDVERYLKLENEYDEKTDEKSEIQSIIQSINNKEIGSKLFNIKTLFSLFITEVILFILGATSLELIQMIKVLSVPAVIALTAVGIIKPIRYGTKKRRAKKKKEAKTNLEKVLEELKQIDKERRKLKEKIEYENYFPEEEIVPVTTVENTKANVKMRILRLDKNTIYENVN